MADSGTGEKTEKATPKKRRDERRKGNIFTSKDVVSVVFVFGAFCSMRLLFPGIARNASAFMVSMVEGISNPTALSLGNLKLLGYDFALTVAKCILPLLLICVLLGVLATAIQTKFLFTMKPLKPKLSKLSPLKGIKKLFSLRNLVEVIKGILKVIIMGIILYLVFKGDIVSLVRMLDMDVKMSLSHILLTIFELVLKLCMVFVFIAFFDWMYQRWEYERSIKMSKQDIKEEHKQTEGNPQIKGKIKEMQRKRSRMRMMQAIEKADVIIKNPTHFAVALRYDMDIDSAPVVLAKGQDEVAKRIIAEGQRHGLTIIENKALARAIYATTEINQEIPVDYYSAVAEVLVYVYKLNKKVGISA